MAALRTYFDTDAASVLAESEDRRLVIDSVRRRQIEPIVSDSLIEEVLLTSNTGLRRTIAATVLCLLGSRHVLAPVSRQVRWSCANFAAGDTRFVPFQSEDEDRARRFLIRPSELTVDLISLAHEKRSREAQRWDDMHARGRAIFQERVAREGGKLPTPTEYLRNVESEFSKDVVRNLVPESLANRLAGREVEIIRWNPILCAYLELMVLAIHRHAVEPPNVASKKGPKWPDYFHGAYCCAADIFVTNDSRFRRALEQHSELGTAGHYAVMNLNDFVAALKGGTAMRLGRALDFSWRRLLPAAVS